MDARVTAIVENHLKKVSKALDYELYWVAKVLALPIVKEKIIASLVAPNSFSFWGAHALAEVWGKADFDVRGIFLAKQNGSPREVATVAEYLHLITDDPRASRAAIIKAFSGPNERAGFLVRGLRNLGVSQSDEEAFSACLSAGSRHRAPAYDDEWRREMILTFPSREQVRAIAMEEIDRREGGIGAVAVSFRNDDQICSRLLSVVSPLNENARLLLVSELQAAATSSPRAARALGNVREDTQGAVSSESTIGTIEAKIANNAIQPDDIAELVAELDAVGPDFEYRRAAAVVGLAITGNLAEAANKKGRDGKPETFNLNVTMPGDDNRYLRRLLPYWPQLIQAFGGEDNTLERFELSPAVTLSAINPGVENANHLYVLMMERAKNAPHVDALDLLRLSQRFEPSGQRTRELITQLILPPPTVGEMRDEYWARLVAGEIFAESFADDAELVSQVIDRFTEKPSSYPVAAALAELYLRNSSEELGSLLREKISNERYERATYFKLFAALGSPERLRNELHEMLVGDTSALNEYQLVRWIPAMLRRIRKDVRVREVLLGDVQVASNPSIQVSFAALVGRATGSTPELRAFALKELARLENATAALVGFDLVSGAHRQAAHVFSELLQ